MRVVIELELDESGRLVDLTTHEGQTDTEPRPYVGDFDPRTLTREQLQKKLEPERQWWAEEASREAAVRDIAARLLSKGEDTSEGVVRAVVGMALRLGRTPETRDLGEPILRILASVAVLGGGSVESEVSETHMVLLRSGNNFAHVELKEGRIDFTLPSDVAYEHPGASPGRQWVYAMKGPEDPGKRHPGGHWITSPMGGSAGVPSNWTERIRLI
jgi:hypothetical protein